MSDESPDDDRIADAGQQAFDAAAIQQRMQAEADAAAANARTAEGGEEAVRQTGLIYAGLIAIAVVIMQGFLESPSNDASARISVIAFSVAIPLLAALVLVNRQETYRRRSTPSVSVTVAQSVAMGAALVGVVAGFWHIYWIAGVVFLATAFVGLFVHSAGWWRLESKLARDRETTP
jgi:hypothetical protein